MERISTMKHMNGFGKPEVLDKINVPSGFYVRDPISALTHAIGFIAAIFLTPVMLTHASGAGANFIEMTALCIFMISMILLYGASTSYHTFPLSEAGVKKLKKLDHAMIFILIAGSYTPVCLIALPGSTGNWLLSLVWGFAIAGIIFKMFWVTCPKWVSSVIYIAMGWLCVFAMNDIIASLTKANFLWLLFGGIAYTVGGVIYGMQKVIYKMRGIVPGSEPRYHFGGHEIFHIFVMIGTACHFVVMYNLI